MHPWPFVGRAEELAMIRALASRSEAVLITGPPGIGRTALARHVLADLGGRTEWVVGTRSAAAIPFGAVAQLASQRAGPSPDGLLRDIAREARVLAGLGVDDAHLLDDCSAAVIADIVRRGPAFVVMTSRTGAPLSDALTALVKEGRARILELAPLPTAVMEQLIDAHGEATIDGLRRRRLGQEAAGNPMALRELLLGRTPGGVTELATARIAQWDPGTRRVAELVASAEPLSLALVEAMAPAGAIAAAEEAGAIVVERSGARAEVRLEPPIVGTVLRAAMARSRRRQLLRGLVGYLLAGPMRRRDDVLSAARWQLDAGAIVRPDVVLEAAAQAIGRADLDLAERLARAGRAATPGPEADRLLAEILEYRGSSEEAAAILDEPGPPRVDPVRWAITRADTCYWGYGDVRAAERILDSVAEDPMARSSRSWIAFFDGRPQSALDLADSVDADPEAPPQAQLWAAAARVASAGFVGRRTYAVTSYAEARAMALAHHDELPYAVFQVDVGACLAHLALGQPAAAEAVAARGQREAVQAGVQMMVVGWSLYSGLSNLARGHLGPAETQLRLAVSGFGENDAYRHSRCGLAALAAVAGLRGNVQEADDLVRRVDKLPTGPNRVFEPWIRQWRAWAVAAAGDLSEAVECARSAAELARELGLSGVESQARYDVVRLGGDPGPAGPGPDDLFRRATRASLTPGGGALLALAREFEAAGYDLPAAEAAGSAAHAYRAEGRRAKSVLAAAVAASLRTRCGATRTPQLRRSGPLGELTPREREVALLAAHCSSRDIGHRLGLAVTTVNNNLARAYAKLGVSSRAELRALLDED